MKNILKLPAVLVISFFIAACASSSKKAAPAGEVKKMESYPSPEDSKKAAEIFYRNLERKKITEEEKDFLTKATVDKNPVASYLFGNIFYTGEKFEHAKLFLKPSADQGFGPAQLEYAISCAKTKCKVHETYAYLLLASKSSLYQASAQAKSMVEKLSPKISGKIKTKAQKLAAQIEYAYLPEFETQVFLTESGYFLVMINQMSDYYQQKAEIEKETKKLEEIKNYAQEKKAL